MSDVLTIISERIAAGNGGPLAITGMSIVFTGLICLFISMTVLRQVLDLSEKIKNRKAPDSIEGKFQRKGEPENNNILQRLGLIIVLSYFPNLLNKSNG